MENNKFCSIGEVADLLNVTKKRIYQLIGKTDFPAPYQQLQMGPIWTHEAILAYKTYSDEKYKRVNDLLPESEKVTKHGQGSDMKAVMAMHQNTKKGSILKQHMKDVLVENGWLDYYRSLVRKPLV